MRSQGVKILADLSTQSSIGIQESIRFIKPSIGLLKRTLSWIKAQGVDLFLAIDGQGRNLSLGASIQTLGIKTVYYFPPLAFLWGAWNIPKLRKYDLLICPFVPNQQFLEKKGCKTVASGHPFSTYNQQFNPLKAKESLGLDKRKKIISLFPGSRYQEIENLTPIFLETMKRLLNLRTQAKLKESDEIEIVMALSHEDFRTSIEVEIEKSSLDIKLLDSDKTELIMQASDFLLAASGTVTLQAAFHYLPTAIAYKISRFSAWLGKKLLKGGMFGMPNILAGKELFKEFLNKDCNPNTLSWHINNVLFDQSKYQQLVADIKELITAIKVDNHEKILAESIYKLLATIPNKH